MSKIMLKELYIHNFKSFYKSTFKFGKLNCLIAPNNTGKSNLIEALEFLDNLIYQNPARAFAKVGIDPTNYHYDDDNIITINAEFEIHNLVLINDILIEYKIELLYLFNIDYVSKVPIIDIIVNNSKIKAIQIDNADLNNGLKERVFNNIAEYINNFNIYTDRLDTKRFASFDFDYNNNTLSYNIKSRHQNTEKLVKILFGLGIGKEYESKPTRLDLRLLFNRSSLFSSHYFHPNNMKTTQNSGYNYLLKDGTNLPEYLNSLDKNTFEDISTSLIGEVELIDSVEVKDGFTTELIFNEELNGKIYPVKLQKVSDGTVHFVSIMSALIGNNYSIGMMIEEPERHMHMKVLSYILNTMRDDAKQIFFTTHSGELLKELNQEEIIFLYRDEDTGDTKSLNASKIKQLDKIFKKYKYEISDIIKDSVLGYIGDYDG